MVPSSWVWMVNAPEERARPAGTSIGGMGMADPMHFIHLVITAALYVLGMLLIADGIQESPHLRRSETHKQ